MPAPGRPWFTPSPRERWIPRSLSIVLRDVGGLLALIGGVMLAPVVVALIYWEPYSAAALLAASAITAASGYALYRTFRDAPDPKLRHALVTAGAGWLAVASFGALPLFLAAHWTPASVIAGFVPAGADYASSLHVFRQPLNALFESMSGYTTTGLTMTVHEPSLPHALLFYRSLMQWVGGAGVVVLALAIFSQGTGSGAYSLYQSEARRRRVRPSVVATARSIARVYVALTLVVAAFLAAATFLILPEYGVEATLFDAVNHAMTGQATGGFSTLDDSIAGYGSYLMELVHIPPMILGAIALPLYYVAFRERSLDTFTRDPQVRTLFWLVVLGVPTMAYLLARTTFPIPELGTGWTTQVAGFVQAGAVREGVFQFVSALTGTGWQTSSIGAWAAAPILWIVFLGMNIQGSAGSTTGGIKLFRAYLLAKGLVWQVARSFLPENAVQTMTVGDRVLEEDQIDEELREAAMLALAYLLFLALGIVLFILVDPNAPVSHAVFEVASAQGTVGLSAGPTGPAMPEILKGSFVFLMWLGRLEIFPVLAFLRALTWGMDFR